MQLRNIAIIAHVDHGKTTLVDELLKQSGAFRANQNVAERVMDSNDLERERGITILAKATSVTWNDIRINIVDTPGHADFGGEVERILSMVDGVVLLVDAAEGPLPQTKFVLGKALRLGLKPILLINKIDRSDARPHEVHSEVLDLFISLDADEEQLEFPTLYASGRQGWATDKLDGERKDLTPLFDMILNHVPAPKVVANKDGFFKMLATTLESDNFLGRLLTGRIESGVAKPNMNVKALAADGTLIENARIQKVLAWRGVQRVPLDEAQAGDIITIAGFTKATVADTLCDVGVTEALQAQPIDPPTIAMTFSVNDGPLAGTEGSKVTSRLIGDRLRREAEGNVAIQVRQTESADAFEVAGRGELQLGVLIEQMRREGFELSISRPRVVVQTDDAGNKLEPYETAVIDVDDEYTGTVINKMNERKADLQDMRATAGKTRLTFLVPSRGLIGYHSEFLTDTRGTGVMNRLFHSYGPWKGTLAGRRNGVLISTDNGEAVAYAIFYLQERGAMFISPGVKVYAGMVVGENSRDNDLEINVLKEKKLSNVRASGKDEAMILVPPVQMTLERALSYIQEDELVEVTPKTIRLRKKHLDSNLRKREEKKAAAEG
jgi:GTP-binding protein